MIKKIVVACLLCLSFVNGYAQKSMGVGIKLLNEFDPDGGDFSPGVGGQLVYRITKHSGLETGLYYSNQTNRFYFYQNNFNFYEVIIAERWLVLPLLYRFDSRIVNFTVGPQIDYFLGWKNKNRNPSVLVNSYSRQSARLALSGGFSKSIKLSELFTLEPEARLLFYPSDEYGSIGLNVALRRKLF